VFANLAVSEGPLAVVGADLHQPAVKAGSADETAPAADRPSDSASSTVDEQDAAHGAVTYLAGYAADTAIGEDDLNIAEDVDSLCSVLMAEQVHPPLSVGLFGDWGTGKSFFMQKMREHIDRLATQSATARNEGRPSDYCENVRQITFNAWHYVDANLWASLVTRIFDGLVGGDLDETELLTEEDRQRREQRRQLLLAKLETAEVLAGDARRRRDVATDRLQAKQAERNQKNDAISSLAALRVADVQAAVREQPEVAAMAADAIEARTKERFEPAEAIALSREVHGTWSAIRRIWRRMQPSARVQLVVFAMVATSAAVILATVGHSLLIRLFAALTVLLPAVVVALRWLPTIRQVRIAAEAAAETVEHAVQREHRRLDAELTTVRAQIDDAQRQVEEAEQEIREIGEGRRLRDFIEGRATSEDYRRSLGLIALIRRDLARLSALMAARDPAAGDEPDRIDRIILYIDDLDRCPAQRVVEVLEAVHLLLAFPLFVVVVGVDARWLLRSLELRYTELISPDSGEGDPEEALHWAATPQNYLEKIFQIPFSLRPMEEHGFAQLIRSAVGAPPQGPNGAATVRVGDGDSGAQKAAPSAEPAPAIGTQTESHSRLPRSVGLEAASAATEVSRSAVAGTPAALVFAARGRRLATVYGGVVALLDPRTGFTTTTRRLEGGAATATLSPEGSLIAIPTPGGLQVQDLLSGATVDTWKTSITLPAFSLDGRWISGLEEGRVVAREPLTKRELRFENTAPEGTETCQILPGAQAAVVAGDYGVRLVPFTSTVPIVPLIDHKVHALAYSIDGQVIAAADGESVRLWDAASGRLLDWFSIGRRINALSLASTGSQLAVAFGTELAVIDRETATKFAQASHDGESTIERIVFGWDGHILASAGQDAIRVWAPDPASGGLTSESLRLNKSEVEFLQRLLPLVPTPRAAKRLVNVYRILRAPLRGEDLDRLVGANDHKPEHPAVLLLLAIVSGFPEQANQIIEGLLERPKPTWREFVDTLRQDVADEPDTPDHAVWSRFFERLDSVEAKDIPNDITTYAHWAPRVARYSFRTGRLTQQRKDEKQ
jgi:hypothetical protein